MDVYLPKTPKKKKHAISLAQVAARWRVRTAHARWLLQQAGVPIVDVDLKPAKGVRLADLLVFEETLRKQKTKEKTPTLKVLK